MARAWLIHLITMIRSGHPISPSLSRTAHASVGVIATEITNARSDVLEWIKEQLEDVIDRRRTASVKDEIDQLALAILTMLWDAANVLLAVHLLGGRKPSKKSRSLHGAGSWGVLDQASYKVCIPRAFSHLGRIIGQVWGVAFGCSLTEGADFGISRRADAAAEQLSCENCKLFLLDWGERITEAAERFRTRRPTELPDIEALGDETEDEKLTPIITKQDAEEAAEARADSRVTQLLASAGVKRPASSPAASSASQPVVAQLVAQPSGGAQAAAPSGQQPPLSKTAKRKASAAAKAAALASGVQPAQPQPKQTPVTFAQVAQGGQVRLPTPAQIAAVGPAAPAAAASPAAAGWAPSFQPGEFQRPFSDEKATPVVHGAVAGFNWSCRHEHGLSAHMPCAIQSLTGTCRGPPSCRTCAAQAQRQPPTPTPAGLVAKVKAACNAATAQMITQ